MRTQPFAPDPAEEGEGLTPQKRPTGHAHPLSVARGGSRLSVGGLPVRDRKIKRGHRAWQCDSVTLHRATDYLVCPVPGADAKDDDHAIETSRHEDRPFGVGRYRPRSHGLRRECERCRAVEGGGDLLDPRRPGEAGGWRPRRGLDPRRPRCRRTWLQPGPRGRAQNSPPPISSWSTASAWKAGSTG